MIRPSAWATERTSHPARDARSAGIRGSRFVHAGAPWPWSIKLEGSRRLGARKVSLIHIDPADHTIEGAPMSAREDGAVAGIARVARIETADGMRMDVGVCSWPIALALWLRIDQLRLKPVKTVINKAKLAEILGGRVC